MWAGACRGIGTSNGEDQESPAKPRPHRPIECELLSAVHRRDGGGIQCTLRALFPPGPGADVDWGAPSRCADAAGASPVPVKTRTEVRFLLDSLPRQPEAIRLDPPDLFTIGSIQGNRSGVDPQSLVLRTSIMTL